MEDHICPRLNCITSLMFMEGVIHIIIQSDMIIQEIGFKFIRKLEVYAYQELSFFV